MLVLFVSHSKNDAVQLWYASGCHLDHRFEHLTVTTIDELLKGISEIQPDLVIVSYNVGSVLHSGVDVVLMMQDDFTKIELAENNSVTEDYFSHRGVKVGFNVQGDPDRLVQLIQSVAV